MDIVISIPTRLDVKSKEEKLSLNFETLLLKKFTQIKSAIILKWPLPMVHYPINQIWEEWFPRPKSGKQYNPAIVHRTHKPGLSEMRYYDNIKAIKSINSKSLEAMTSKLEFEMNNYFKFKLYLDLADFWPTSCLFLWQAWRWENCFRTRLYSLHSNLPFINKYSCFKLHFLRKVRF